MLDDYLFRPLLSFLLKLFFDVKVSGLEHARAAGDKVLVIANHQSFLDPLILAVFLPQKPGFAISVYQADKWYFRWFDKVVTLYRLDPSKPLSMKRLIRDMREGAKVVLFPEGRITTSGGIMKIYDGAGLIAQKTGATLLPARIDGAEYSKFSRMGGKLRQRWFPKIRLTFLPPVRFEEGKAVTTQHIYDVMTKAAFDAADYRKPLLAAFLDAAAWHGGAHKVAEDVARLGMSYRQLFTRAFVLSKKLDVILSEAKDPSASPQDDKYVAMLLPNALGAMVTLVSLHMLGRVPCMLNFSAGEANMLHACRIAGAKTVLTSRVFIEKGKLEAVAAALERECRVIYLEDIRATVGLADKLSGAWKGLMPRAHVQKALAVDAGEPAVILYTSGSEGVPKGVALSHVNILANIQQAVARLDLRPSDVLFNAMPVFHSFGLTVGLVLPLVSGIRTFLYPSPLHYRVIPELVYDSDATIIVGTDTFYNGYARMADPYDFWNIRLAVAGAEKLKDATRLRFFEQFGVSIFEGYGVTETSPVIAVNTPMEHKAGTVGRALPGIECRLETVEGLEGGRLSVRGPNVMLGYLDANRPGTIRPQGEWYDTGDIVAIDDEGFISIKGRAKRFAKIAGEMVSLQVAEDVAAGLFSEAGHAALAVGDERKGEQVVLYTEVQALTREDLQKAAKDKGIPEIALPKQVVFIKALPRLGSGKVDYVALAKL